MTGPCEQFRPSWSQHWQHCISQQYFALRTNGMKKGILFHFIKIIYCLRQEQSQIFGCYSISLLFFDICLIYFFFALTKRVTMSNFNINSSNNTNSVRNIARDSNSIEDNLWNITNVYSFENIMILINWPFFFLCMWSQ